MKKLQKTTIRSLVAIDFRVLKTVAMTATTIAEKDILSDQLSDRKFTHDKKLSKVIDWFLHLKDYL
jgi:hypothetical protein